MNLDMKAILIPIFGGLGNQMFQVAHGVTLARRRGLEARFVDLTSTVGRVAREFGLDCFNIDQLFISQFKSDLLRLRISASQRLQRIHPYLHLGVLLENIERPAKNLESICTVCSGYWQGEKYFSADKEAIRAIFTFPNYDIPADLIHTDSLRNSVAVHVRRGDYISDPVARNYHHVCDTNWYFLAINEIRSRLQQPRFYIFSDDRAWVSEVFGGLSDVIVVNSDPCAPAWVDMALMSRCSNFVISNSSYSWWASYLGKTADSLIIAPKYWFSGVSTKKLDIMCEDWILL